MNALIIVDVQNDFCPGGALPVREGRKVVPVLNAVQDRFDLVVATQDWHPPDHLSFASQHGRRPGEVIRLEGLDQILWPDHCVQGNPGAELVRELDVRRVERVFRKGTDRRVDSYSGFFDNGRRKATGLGDFLKARGVGEVFVAGLATDYCVKYTALDAAGLGFGTHVVADACRGVNLAEGDADKALGEMRERGIRVLESSAVPHPRARA